MEQQRRSMAVLRWITFIPGAFLFAVLAWVLFYWVNRLSITLVGYDPDNLFPRLFLEIGSNGVEGAMFVYAGSRIAPASRKVIAYTLAIGALLIAGFLAFHAIVHQNWWAVVGFIAMAGGAGWVVYKVAKGELNLNAHRLLT